MKNSQNKRVIADIFLLPVAFALFLSVAGAQTGASSLDVSGGADRIEGWIIKKDAKGRIVKIPKRQTFQFDGSNVESGVMRPAESSVFRRTTPSEMSLIPLRRDFRQEFHNSVGVTTPAKRPNRRVSR